MKFHKCNPAITQIDIQGILGDGRLSLQALDFMPDKAKVVVSYLSFFFVPISFFSTLICLKFGTNTSKIWQQNEKRRKKSYKKEKDQSWINQRVAEKLFKLLSKQLKDPTKKAHKHINPSQKVSKKS